MNGVVGGEEKGGEGEGRRFLLRWMFSGEHIL
jgi:hypothetical protein